MDYDVIDSSNELNPEDASLPSENSDGDDDKDFNKIRDREISAFLDL